MTFREQSVIVKYMAKAVQPYNRLLKVYQTPKTSCREKTNTNSAAVKDVRAVPKWFSQEIKFPESAMCPGIALLTLQKGCICIFM